MDRTIPFERVKKIALENAEFIRQHVCKPHKAAVVVVKHYLETGEALRTCAGGWGDNPNVMAKLTKAIETFIRGLDVRCVGELMELIPKGLDDRLPRWLYGPVDAYLEDGGWVLAPRAA